MFIIKLIDDFLNSITMYRLMLYFLIILLLIALVLSFFGLIPFKPTDLMLSAVSLTIFCWVANTLLAKIFQAPTNLESTYITALILSLIITPINLLNNLPILFWLAVFAIASKYILAIGKKHIFNPAAFVIALSPFILNIGASWWIGNIWMMSFVTTGGLLIIRKIQRGSMVLSLLLIALAVILIPSILRGNDLLVTMERVILESPLFFFAFVMLTEPQTSPANKRMQIFYGLLVGFLYTRPELALLAGNLFSYLVNPKEKLRLRLKEKIQTAPDIYDFTFNLDKKFTYLPGQYMEWTLGHKNPDNRGNRRYFTLASSPAEGNLCIGVKFSPEGSSFKKALLALKPGDEVITNNLAGDFTLPKDPNIKLCFLAGGIGITPFRSMIKYLVDTKQKRDTVLIYSAKAAEDFVYKDIFNDAKKIGVKTVLRIGQIDKEMIKKEVSNVRNRNFYISGPHSMVKSFETTLQEMGIPKYQIKVDFFPGYA